MNYEDTINQIKDLLNITEKSKSIKNISIEKGIKIYFEYLETKVNRNTIEHYKNHITTIYRYLKENKIKTFNQLNEKQIYKYIEYCKMRENKARTINIRLGMIKRMKNYLISKNLIEDKKININQLRETKPKIKYLKLEDIEKVLKEKNRLSAENRLIVDLLIQTGMRRTDITNIKLKNISFTNQSIFIEDNKTHIEMEYFVDGQLLIDILDQAKNKRYWLFESNKGQITADKISSVFKRLKKKTGIKELSPHKLRHSYATYLVKNNINIYQVAKLLGHTNINTTMRYLHEDTETLKKITLETNPLTLIKKKSIGK